VKAPEKIQEEKKAETTEKNDKEQNSEKVDHKKKYCSKCYRKDRLYLVLNIYLSRNRDSLSIGKQTCFKTPL